MGGVAPMNLPPVLMGFNDRCPASAKSVSFSSSCMSLIAISVSSSYESSGMGRADVRMDIVWCSHKRRTLQFVDIYTSQNKILSRLLQNILKVSTYLRLLGTRRDTRRESTHLFRKIGRGRESARSSPVKCKSGLNRKSKWESKNIYVFE